jgi:hypothetical protein
MAHRLLLSFYLKPSYVLQIIFAYGSIFVSLSIIFLDYKIVIFLKLDIECNFKFDLANYNLLD